MGNLLLILIILFVALLLVIKLTERFSKPLQAEESQRLSKIILFLIVLVMLASAIKML
jgi:hypothetical protein